MAKLRTSEIMNRERREREQLETVQVMGILSSFEFKIVLAIDRHSREKEGFI